jgi:hypothetical protein
MAACPEALTPMPDFGPDGYLPALPFPIQPVADRELIQPLTASPEALGRM